MEYKIVYYVGRNPRRAESNVNIVSCDIGTDHFFQSLNVLCKNTGIFFVCILGKTKLVHKISRKILVRSFPSLVKAFVPHKRILIN